MGYFDDYASAVQFYPETNVDLEIVDISYSDGGRLNQDEDGDFRIQITNRGPLTLRDVEFRVKALNGMRVAHGTAHHPWVDELTTTHGAVDVVEHNQTRKTQPFRFLAPGAPQPPRDLIEVSLAAWDADPDHIYKNHTGSLPSVKATYNDRVRPD